MEEIENKIIELGLEIVKTDFMQYPDYDESLDFTFLDAFTAILAEKIEDFDSSEIYDFLKSKLNN